MANKNTNIPLLIFIICFIGGVGIGAWGWIKEDCQGGPGCWIGSGFLIWTGVTMIIGGLLGMLLIGGKTKR